MAINTIKQQTKDLIDRLKSTTNNIGLGNSGNEYTVIVETFLYKFLNDKFIYEAKRMRHWSNCPMMNTKKCVI